VATWDRVVLQSALRFFVINVAIALRGGFSQFLVNEQGVSGCVTNCDCVVELLYGWLVLTVGSVVHCQHAAVRVAGVDCRVRGSLPACCCTEGWC
jgi:hypothetical protein